MVVLICGRRPRLGELDTRSAVAPSPSSSSSSRSACTVTRIRHGLSWFSPVTTDRAGEELGPRRPADWGVMMKSCSWSVLLLVCEGARLGFRGVRVGERREVASADMARGSGEDERGEEKASNAIACKCVAVALRRAGRVLCLMQLTAYSRHKVVRKADTITEISDDGVSNASGATFSGRMPEAGGS